MLWLGGPWLPPQHLRLLPSPAVLFPGFFGCPVNYHSPLQEWYTPGAGRGGGGSLHTLPQNGVPYHTTTLCRGTRCNAWANLYKVMCQWICHHTPSHIRGFQRMECKPKWLHNPYLLRFPKVRGNQNGYTIPSVLGPQSREQTKRLHWPVFTIWEITLHLLIVHGTRHNVGGEISRRGKVPFS